MWLGWWSSTSTSTSIELIDELVMMKNKILRTVFIFFVGCIAGACAMSFFTLSVTEKKAVSYYAIGLENIEKDIDEAMLMFVYSSTLKPDWYAPHLGMAQCFEIRENYFSAIKEYKKAISLREESNVASYENEKVSKKIKKLQTELSKKVEKIEAISN
jgi:hypothetical protein